MKDLEQMIERDCFELVHREELNETTRRRAMESLIFLSEKRTSRSRPGTVRMAVPSEVICRERRFRAQQ
jgi:hypothetical protein